MKLYTYYRSSAAYRVRIALNLKGLEAEPLYRHLRKGEQRAPDYLALNPQGLLPTLIDGPVTIGQSLAILEYLEETHPEPALLPSDPAGRARVRQLAQLVACDIHPLNNLKVLNFISSPDGLGLDEAARLHWYRHWIADGFGALERLLAEGRPEGAFCHGAAPGLADCCLVPQVYNAERFEVDLSAYPTIQAVNAACLALPAFAGAAPDSQPDAE